MIAEECRHNVVVRWGDSLVTGTADFDTRVLANTDWLMTRRWMRRAASSAPTATPCSIFR